MYGKYENTSIFNLRHYCRNKFSLIQPSKGIIRMFASYMFIIYFSFRLTCLFRVEFTKHKVFKQLMVCSLNVVKESNSDILKFYLGFQSVEITFRKNEAHNVDKVTLLVEKKWNKSTLKMTCCNHFFHQTQFKYHLNKLRKHQTIRRNVAEDVIFWSIP